MGHVFLDNLERQFVTDASHKLKTPAAEIAEEISLLGVQDSFFRLFSIMRSNTLIQAGLSGSPCRRVDGMSASPSPIPAPDRTRSSCPGISRP